MSIVAIERPSKAKASTAVGPWPLVGTLHSVTAEGVALIDYPGNAGGPLPARAVATMDAADCVPGTALLLVFEDEDPARPVIVDLVADRIRGAGLPTTRVANRRAHDVVVDGRRLVFEGHEEIVLRCGRGSITLTADGRVVVKGTELVSRSSGVNKIRGALVNIN
jgi:hypothetical protein